MRATTLEFPAHRKGLPALGHDITDEDTPLEAGLGFAVKFDKPGGFIGREALLRKNKRVVQAPGAVQAEVARAPAVPQ